MHLGTGRDGEALTKRGLGSHTRTHVHVHSALVWPLSMPHRGNKFGGHALTVGMNTCIVCVCVCVCVCSLKRPFFRGPYRGRWPHDKYKLPRHLR